MGVLNWLRGAGGKVMKGINWLGQNIGKPIMGIAKHLPVVGDVVRAAEPLVSTVSKTTQWAEDKLNNVAADKRRPPPTFDELKGAVGSAINTGKTIATKLATKGMV